MTKSKLAHPHSPPPQQQYILEDQQISVSASKDVIDLGVYPDTSAGHYNFGVLLGRSMRDDIQKFVYEEEWCMEAWNGLRENAEVTAFSQKLQQFNEAKFPRYFDELHGLAAGAEVPFQRIWVAVAQQEILGALKLAAKARPRGCSDLLVARTKGGGDTEGGSICHNEDGEKFLLGRGKLVRFGFQINPHSQWWGFGFCYPGALPGWGPAFNSHGIVYSINCLYPQSPSM